MLASRYSEMEMNQWDHACAQPMDCVSTAPRAAGAFPAKGQAGRARRQPQMRLTPSRQATPTQTAEPDDWASECLFDCYNG